MKPARVRVHSLVETLKVCQVTASRQLGSAELGVPAGGWLEITEDKDGAGLAFGTPALGSLQATKIAAGTSNSPILKAITRLQAWTGGNGLAPVDQPEAAALRVAENA